MAVNHSLYEFFQVSHKTCEDLLELEDESEEEAAEVVQKEKPPCKKYKRCFCPSWKGKFMWLQYKDGSMYCTYCLETNKHNSYTSGCQNFRTSDIQKHSKSRDHCSATEVYAMKLSGYIYQVRWLSFDIAVDAVLRSLKSLMMFFEHAANEGDPTAVGIHSCITTYKFLALTHLIKDILSVLTKLSLTFQSQQVDISLVHSNVTAAIDALDNMISHSGPNLEEFTRAFANGKYILYNISDNNSQRTSFELARRNFITKTERQFVRSFCGQCSTKCFQNI